NLMNSRTCVWLSSHLQRNYCRDCFLTYCLDEAEPEFGVYDYDGYRTHLGPYQQVGNLYPQAFARAVFEGQQAAGETEIVNLVRCAWAGSQRFEIGRASCRERV